MTQVITDPETQVPMEVVEPGSPEDPFKGTSDGTPSAVVSVEGTPQEVPAPTGDGDPAASVTAPVVPAAAPSETPAAPAPAPEAPVLPATSSVVEVLPAAAPVVEVAPVAETPAGDEKPAEEATAAPLSEDAAKVLQDAIQAQVAEALRGQQSTNDQRAAKLEKLAEAAAGENKTLTDQIRNLEMRELTDEERAKVQAVHAQADERAALDEFRDELAVVNSDLYVRALMLDYEQYGVKAEQLESLKTPEEMDVFCLEVKAESLEKQLAEVPAVPAVAAAVAPAAVPATAALPQEPPKAVAQAVAQVPAAAQVATDMGSPGAAQPETTFSEETGQKALQDNLKAADWTTVRIRG